MRLGSEKRSSRSALRHVGFAVVALCIAVAPLVEASPAGASDNKDGATAGYYVGTASPYTTATGKFRIPVFSCPPSGTFTVEIMALWSAAGYDAGMTADLTCSEGVPSVAAAIHRGSSSGAIPVSQGDVLAAHLRYDTPTGIVRFTVRNQTQGHWFPFVSDKELGLTWGDAAFTLYVFGSCTDVPTFTRVTFGRLTFDGMPVAEAASPVQGGSLTAWDQWCANTHKTIVRASAINDTGTAFALIGRLTT